MILKREDATRIKAIFYVQLLTAFFFYYKEVIARSSAKKSVK
jgi:hypothetical protein